VMVRRRLSTIRTAIAKDAQKTPKILFFIR
jgi:hypothetical protein